MVPGERVASLVGRLGASRPAPAAHAAVLRLLLSRPLSTDLHGCSSTVGEVGTGVSTRGQRHRFQFRLMARATDLRRAASRVESRLSRRWDRYRHPAGRRD
jgi:hypothetical protein